MNSVGNHMVRSTLKSNRFIWPNKLVINPLIRCYSEKKETNPEDFLRVFRERVAKFNFLEHVVSFAIPGFRNTLFANLFLMTKMREIDSTFDKQEFMSNCQEATIEFCNLIANNRIDECADLMTPEAYQNLVKKYKDVSEDRLARLRLTDDKIDFQNLIFLHEFKEDDKRFVEATFTVLKKSENKEFEPLYLFSELFILKFIRDYTKGANSNTDWSISYFDHKYFEEKPSED